VYKSLTIFLLALLPQLAAKLVAWVTLDRFHPSADASLCSGCFCLCYFLS